MPTFLFGEEKAWQPINANQPISIGERIYSTSGSDGYAAHGVVYSYGGCDGKSITIKIVKHAVSAVGQGYNREFDPEYRVLPLNKNSQALLKVEMLDKKYPIEEIIITVIDEFYRIKAEEYKK